MPFVEIFGIGAIEFMPSLFFNIEYSKPEEPVESQDSGALVCKEVTPVGERQCLRS